MSITDYINIHAKSILAVRYTTGRNKGILDNLQKWRLHFSGAQRTRSDYLKEAPFSKKATTVRSTACVFVAPRVSVASVDGTPFEEHIEQENLIGPRAPSGKTTSGFAAHLSGFIAHPKSGFLTFLI